MWAREDTRGGVRDDTSGGAREEGYEDMSKQTGVLPVLCIQSLLVLLQVGMKDDMEVVKEGAKKPSTAMTKEKTGMMVTDPQCNARILLDAQEKKKRKKRTHPQEPISWVAR